MQRGTKTVLSAVRIANLRMERACRCSGPWPGGRKAPSDAGTRHARARRPQGKTGSAREEKRGLKLGITQKMQRVCRERAREKAP